jgi:hypothetical protein
MNKYNVGDRVVVDGYSEFVDGQAGVILDVPDEIQHWYYEVRLDQPNARLQEWLFSESEIRPE